MATISTTVLIVGAGPVGLWLALELRRASLDVLVIDKKQSCDERNVFSKALTMSAGSLATFHSRGLVDLFLPKGIPLRKAHFGGIETLLELNYDVLGVRHPFNLAIPQTETEQILLVQCQEAGVRFAWGLKFIHLEQYPQFVTATTEKVLSDAGAADEIVDIEARWVVGCDGTHSDVRQAAGIHFKGVPSSEASCFVSDIQLATRPDSNLVVQRNSNGTYMLINIGDGIHYRFLGVLGPGFRKATSDPVTLNEIKSHLELAFKSDLGAHSPLWMSRIGNACRFATSFRNGRVFLAGDAAHQLFPAGGQGMNIGFQDATNLAWKLVMVSKEKLDTGDSRNSQGERILDSYSRERVPITVEVMENVHAQLACLTASEEWQSALRNVIAEALAIPDLNMLWARRLCGFGEPLTPYLVGEFKEDELVGARLTHLLLPRPFEDELFQSLRTGQFVLLLFMDSHKEGGSKGMQAEAGGWHKWVKVLDMPSMSEDQRWRGVIAVLVRPDLRVAWAGREETLPSQMVSSLTATLEWWFGHKDQNC